MNYYFSNFFPNSMEKKKASCSFFFIAFSNFEFYLINALVCVDMDQGIHKVELKVAQNEKRLYMVFLHMRYGKYLKSFFRALS